ncbi:MAG: hypothetical protein U0L05_00150 [Schaedlerella sp.]|nr:hypothetical protein [Schaedlerella sp.]
MVNLITGQKGSGKTQQVIAIANEKVKTANGNVVLIKKSHRDTYSVDFNVRAICMAEFQDITTQEEFVGFLYGMVAGNHDIETILIDGVLKQADITEDSVADFLQKLNKISKQYNIEFYASVSTMPENIDGIDSEDFKVIA